MSITPGYTNAWYLLEDGDANAASNNNVPSICPLQICKVCDHKTRQSRIQSIHSCDLKSKFLLLICLIEPQHVRVHTGGDDDVDRGLYDSSLVSGTTMYFA